MSGQGTHYPVALSHNDLAWLLDNMRRGFTSGDTLEGFIEFTMSDDEPGKFDVRARYRTGNLQGQGGMRVIGQVPA